MAIKLKALDSFYADDVKQVHARSTFEVDSEDRAKQLVERGLAERAGGSKKEAAASNKAEPAPENKAEPVPENKQVAKEDEGGPGSAGVPDTERNSVDTSGVEDRATIGAEPVAKPAKRGAKK